MAKLLVIDDKADEFRMSLDVALDEHTILYASDAQEGLRALAADADIACVLLDIAMPRKLGKVPEEEGLVALREIRVRRPNLPVIMLTASDEADNMIRAIRMGAYHYLVKPPDAPALRTLVSAALANRELKQRVQELENTIRIRDQLDSLPSGETMFGRLVGASPAMRVVFGRIRRLTDARVPVLILGESGTGKELVAREIHQRGPRARRPFVVVNCANLTGTLLESELFGHERGAFTGADASREGAFRAADGGTLLLDEIAEMSEELQSKLLRVLQESLVKPLGADLERPVDVRVIAATHQRIDQLVPEGRFRQDLFYRLNVVRVVLPPLRERREDIPMLVDHFLKKYDLESKFILGEGAMETLRSRSWPGNVRELENVIQRAVVLADGPELVPRDFHFDETFASTDVALEEKLWRAVLDGSAPSDIGRFAELYGKLALAAMMRRAGEQARTDREAGRLLRFIPEDDPGDKAFNNYRSWKRRVSRLVDEAAETPP